MRKMLFLAGISLLFIFQACKKGATSSAEMGEQSQAVEKRNCGTVEVLNAQLAADPTMANRMDAIEVFTRKAIKSGAVLKAGGTQISIPVIVHVVYNSPGENISDAQVNSQIDVLNEDYKDQNADRNHLPRTSFQDVVSGGMSVQFSLYQIKRVSTKQKSFTTNDNVKSTKQGGSDAIDPSHYLNIWVCNLGQRLLGYAQFPGGPVSTDGVVILYSAFGSRDKYSGGTYINKYDLGRTATHEVGHWMNLRHIWGDDSGACSGSDLVDDTPNQASENYGCPDFPHVSCSNSPAGDMFMNYMDYTDDACMYMFSTGQKLRAEAVFVSRGPRALIGK
jgi:hypothetical protein